MSAKPPCTIRATDGREPYFCLSHWKLIPTLTELEAHIGDKSKFGNFKKAAGKRGGK